MTFEDFKEFMRQSAAKHDAEIGRIQEALSSVTNSLQILVDNQIDLQESVTALTAAQVRHYEEMRKNHEEMRKNHESVMAEIQELSRVVFNHVTDPEAHERLKR